MIYAVLEIIGFITNKSVPVKKEEKEETKKDKKKRNKAIEVKDAKVIEEKEK